VEERGLFHSFQLLVVQLSLCVIARNEAIQGAIISGLSRSMCSARNDAKRGNNIK